LCARVPIAKLWHSTLGFLIDESGVTAIEYAMIGSLIAVVAVVAKASIGSSLSGFFVSVASGL
jgi:pilus assembly protein Flp/PilA